MLVSSYARNEPYTGIDDAYFLEDYTELDQLIQASVTTSVSASGSVTVSRNLEGSIQATATTATLLNVDKLLSSSLTVSTTVTGVAILDHNLESTLSISATVSSTLLVEKQLEGSSDLSVSASGTYFILNPLATDVTQVVSSQADVTVLRPLESSISVTETASADILVQKFLSADILATSSTATVLDVNKPLDSSISTSVSVEGTVSILKELAAEPLLFIESYGSAESLRPVSASLTCQASADAVIDLNKNLESSIAQSVSTTGEVQLLTIIEGSLTSTTTISGTLGVEKFLNGDIASVISTTPAVTVGKPLSAFVSISATAQVIDAFTYITGSSSLSVSTFPLLDVNGNTEGAPGGVPAEGFTPSTSLLLGRQSESSAAQTYIITADFSTEEEPNVMTEMIGYTMSEQLPPDVIEFSLEGPSLVIRVKTPQLILPFFVKYRTQENELRTSRNTFNTGLKTPVDYYLLDKKTEPVELIITATARSYGIGGMTQEVRTAEYKLVIVGDYSASRDGLLNALKLRGVFN